MNPASWLSDSREYLVEVRGEFNKVTWPPQKETVSGTTSVVVIVTVVATVLGVIDFLLSRIMSVVLG